MNQSFVSQVPSVRVFYHRDRLKKKTGVQFGGDRRSRMRWGKALKLDFIHGMQNGCAGVEGGGGETEAREVYTLRQEQWNL